MYLIFCKAWLDFVLYPFSILVQTLFSTRLMGRLSESCPRIRYPSSPLPPRGSLQSRLALSTRHTMKLTIRVNNRAYSPWINAITLCSLINGGLLPHIAASASSVIRYAFIWILSKYYSNYINGNEVYSVKAKPNRDVILCALLRFCFLATCCTVAQLQIVGYVVVLVWGNYVKNVLHHNYHRNDTRMIRRHVLPDSS